MHLLCLNSCNSLLICFMHVLFVDLILLMLLYHRIRGRQVIPWSMEAGKCQKIIWSRLQSDTKLSFRRPLKPLLWRICISLEQGKSFTVGFKLISHSQACGALYFRVKNFCQSVYILPLCMFGHIHEIIAALPILKSQIKYPPKLEVIRGDIPR